MQSETPGVLMNPAGPPEGSEPCLGESMNVLNIKIKQTDRGETDLTAAVF